MTNSCSLALSCQADVLTRQVDVRSSGCLGAMEIVLSAFDHRLRGQTRLIAIPARDGPSLHSRRPHPTKGCRICQLRRASDKLLPRYLVFHQAVEPKDKDNLIAHVGRRAGPRQALHKACRGSWRRKLITAFGSKARRDLDKQF